MFMEDALALMLSCLITPIISHDQDYLTIWALVIKRLILTSS